MSEANAEFMRRAIALSRDALAHGLRPFGAVVVRDGRIIGEAFASQGTDCDPTAHAEILAIRRAAARAQRADLSDCDLYTSAEPCPMCVTAIWYAGIRRVFMGNSHDEFEAIDRENSPAIIEEICSPLNERSRPYERLLPDEAHRVLVEWQQMPSFAAAAKRRRP